MLHLEWRVSGDGIRTLGKLDQTLKRGSLETAAEIYKCLRVVIDFVNGAQLWIESIIVLKMRLVFRAA